MNILFVSAYPPVLDMHGGGVRMYHNIRILARKHNVHVISFVENDEELHRVGELEGTCQTARAVRRDPQAVTRRWSRIPSHIQLFDTADMHQAVDDACRRHQIDVIQCEYVEMAPFHRSSCFNVWSVIELPSETARQGVVKASRLIDRIRGRYRWKSMLRYEAAAAGRFDRVVTMTDSDAAYLRSHAPGADIRAIPVGVDTTHYAGSAEEPDAPLRVVFLGNYRHGPNVEAVQFLVREVVPFFPELQFDIAGPHLPEGILTGTGAHALGYLPDTRTLYRRPNTIVVAPIFSGRGQRVKLLEAFAMGMPVVSTALGAAGFPVRDGREVLLAETPEEFRSALSALRESVQLRERVGSAARRMVIEAFDWNALADRFLEVVDPGT